MKCKVQIKGGVEGIITYEALQIAALVTFPLHLHAALGANPSLTVVLSVHKLCHRQSSPSSDYLFRSRFISPSLTFSSLHPDPYFSNCPQPPNYSRALLLDLWSTLLLLPPCSTKKTTVFYTNIIQEVEEEEEEYSEICSLYL